MDYPVAEGDGAQDLSRRQASSNVHKNLYYGPEPQYETVYGHKFALLDWDLSKDQYDYEPYEEEVESEPEQEEE